MIHTVKKRSGQTVPFDSSKIFNAISKANNAVVSQDRIEDMPSFVQDVVDIIHQNNISNVEEIQNVIEKHLFSEGYFELAKAYVLYREKHRIRREALSKLMNDFSDVLFVDSEYDDTKRENGNINCDNPMALMLKIGTNASKVYSQYYLMPDKFVKMHQENWVHINDLDFSNICWNCLQIDLRRILMRGFNTGHGSIRPPKSIRTAAALAAIILQSSQNDMYSRNHCTLLQ